MPKIYLVLPLALLFAFIALRFPAPTVAQQQVDPPPIDTTQLIQSDLTVTLASEYDAMREENGGSRFRRSNWMPVPPIDGGITQPIGPASWKHDMEASCNTIAITTFSPTVDLYFGYGVEYVDWFLNDIYVSTGSNQSIRLNLPANILLGRYLYSNGLGIYDTFTYYLFLSNYGIYLTPGDSLYAELTPVTKYVGLAPQVGDTITVGNTTYGDWLVRAYDPTYSVGTVIPDIPDTFFCSSPIGAPTVSLGGTTSGEYSYDEGDTGITPVTINLSLDFPSNQPVTAFVRVGSDFENACYFSEEESDYFVSGHRPVNELPPTYDFQCNDHSLYCQPYTFRNYMFPVVFQPGQTQAQVTVNIRGDYQPESNEAFYVALVGSANAYYLQNPNPITGPWDSRLILINDDDSEYDHDARRVYPSDKAMIDNPLCWPPLQFDEIEGAQWYRAVLLDGASNVVEDQWYPATAASPSASTVNIDPICDFNGRCFLPQQSFRSRWSSLPNNDYQLWLTWWGEGDTLSDINARWESSQFSVRVDRPQEIQATYPSGTIHQSPLSLSWQRDENALWYEVWLGSGDYRQMYLTGWYSAAQPVQFINGQFPVCNPWLCNLPTHNLNLPEGDYVWYVRAWGPGGFSRGGIANTGWTERKFSIDTSLERPSYY